MVNSYNRRGISTIVGGMIFLVFLSGGFSAFYVALDVQKDTISTQRDISKSIVEKTLEKFEISTGINPVDNTFEIQVENQGVNPVEITNIWIINKTSPYPANSYDVDYEDAFIPPGFSSDILENTPLYLSPGLYDIKVVSALGTIVTEKKFDPSGSGGEGEEVIVKDSLFGRPQIFMMFPNAIGDDKSQRAVWGVMVANPTDQPMEVTKIVITALSPRTTASDKIFAPQCHNNSDETLPLTIPPTTPRWTCPEANQLMWRDLVTPVTVQPRSVHPFLVEIGADNIGSTTLDALNILIQPIVFTSLGQFGKAGYGSTFHSKETAMPNVFLSETNVQVDAADNDKILGNLTKITEGTEVIFNAVLVDMSGPTYGINAGTKLIINIPRGWIYNIGTGILDSTGFTIISEQQYPDGSTQIVGQLDSGINVRTDARIIQFKATAPDVIGAKMYVMHILADGTATGDSPSGVFTVGPIAETVLQVCPTSGCP